MNVAQISARTGVPARRVRYAIERILPGGPKAGRGRGVDRLFSPLESVGVACAALLHAAGLRRPLAEKCLRVLCTPQGVPSPPAGEAELRIPLQGVQRGQDLCLEIGDGTRMRLRPKAEVPGQPPDARWIDLEGGTGNGRKGEPLTLVRIDLGVLRQRLGDSEEDGWGILAPAGAQETPG